MMAEPSLLHRFAIGDDLGLECLDQLPCRRLAEAPKTFRQPGAGGRTRLFGCKAIGFFQPCDQHRLVRVTFLFADTRHDFPLRFVRKMLPARAEAHFRAQLGGDLVALHVLTVLALFVEAGVGIELERLAQGLERDRLLVFQLQVKQVTLLQC